MKKELGTIYVDGQAIETEYIMDNGNLMVSPYFFKHLGIGVYSENGQSLYIGEPYKEENKVSEEFIDLKGMCNKFGVKVFYNPAIKRTYIVTKVDISKVPKMISRNNVSSKIALTFDDGPDSITTLKILDILKEKGVSATFFVVGKQLEYNPKILERIVKEGHEVGNHGLMHINLTKATMNNVIEEINENEKLIQSIVGVKARIFRPPYGLLTRIDKEIIHNMGYDIIGWNIDTRDYEGTQSDKILEIVERDISPGSIILQHCFENYNGILDGGIQVLPTIIDMIQKSGGSFAKVSELNS